MKKSHMKMIFVISGVVGIGLLAYLLYKYLFQIPKAAASGFASGFGSTIAAPFTAASNAGNDVGTLLASALTGTPIFDLNNLNNVGEAGAAGLGG